MSCSRLSFLCTAAVACLFSTIALGQDDGKIRIGVYDSRAIAIAYAPSKYNPVNENMEKYQQAKAEGDKKRMKELEAWGKKHQRHLHRQGFSIVPVGDLLEHVKPRMDQVADEANVVAIVRKCDFTAKGVEVVDVTDQLVDLFDPSEKTLGIVRSIKSKPAVDLDELDKMRADK